MDLAEAEKVLEAAFPLQGVTVTRDSPTRPYRIARPTGEVLANAFDLTAALRQAVAPVLKAEAAKARQREADRMRDFAVFQTFLRERFNDEFADWCRDRAPDPQPPAGDPGGPEHDPAGLVPVVP